MAKLAYLEATAYCSRELTDGFVPMEHARRYAGKASVIQELAPALWEPCDKGFVVHDYLKYNPTRAQVLAEREAAKRRMFGLRSVEHPPNKERSSGVGTDAPVDPVNPLPIPDPVNPPPLPVPLPARAVVVGFERAFARLLSPTELELVKALEEEHPSERIEFALNEAAALNKRSVRYVQRTCERIANDDSSGANSGKPGAAAHTNGVANRVSGLDRRRAALAARRPPSE